MVKFRNRGQFEKRDFGAFQKKKIRKYWILFLQLVTVLIFASTFLPTKSSAKFSVFEKVKSWSMALWAVRKCPSVHKNEHAEHEYKTGGSFTISSSGIVKIGADIDNFFETSEIFFRVFFSSFRFRSTFSKFFHETAATSRSASSSHWGLGFSKIFGCHISRDAGKSHMFFFRIFPSFLW